MAQSRALGHGDITGGQAAARTEAGARLPQRATAAEEEEEGKGEGRGAVAESQGEATGRWRGEAHRTRSCMVVVDGLIFVDGFFCFVGRQLIGGGQWQRQRRSGGRGASAAGDSGWKGRGGRWG